MADMTFTCPQCKQGIQIDSQWAGHQIQCPTCQAGVTVPKQEASANALVPQVPAGAEPRLSIGSSKAQSSHAPKPMPPSLQKPRYTVKSRRFDFKSMLPVLGIIVVLMVAGVFGWPYLQKWQNKTNAESDGGDSTLAGQVGHINELHSVLDATDPDKMGDSGSGRRGLPNRQAAGAQGFEGSDGGGSAPAPAKALPVVAPVHTLELGSARIPESQVNGTISGTNFLAETIRLDNTGTSQILRFIQGAAASPDREILVYLKVRQADALTNYSLEVTTDKRGSTLPTVVKRWKTNPRYAPQTKPFNYGYAMKLDMKQGDDGQIRGKIYIALPDNEQSVVAGNFTTAANQSMAVGTMPSPSPALPSGMSPSERQMMQQRYGIQ